MGANADVPRIDRGLARYETDHFAILGVPLTADPKRIRRGYLQAAKALHPDRFVGDPEGAERANVLFAKLVNPANEVLTKERERSEYEALLKLRIQRLLESPPADLWPTGEAVKGLAESPNWEEEYVQRVEKLAKEQYSSLATLLEKTEQLSELNLAYLLLKAGYKASPAPAAKTTPLGGIPTSPPAPPPPSPAAPPPPPQPSPAETRFLQALDMIERKQYRAAIQYLNFAISAQPNVARYYLHRGIAHLKQGNAGMAKADFLQASRLEPNNAELMAEVRRWLQQVTTQQPVPVSSASRQTSQPQKVVPPSRKGDSGGFWSRLFGIFGKKK
jgi:curved DNA-binding protein CbpA